VVIGPPSALSPQEDAAGAATLDDMLRDALAGASLRDAAAAVAIACNLPRREVYARALALAGARDKTGDGKRKR